MNLTGLIEHTFLVTINAEIPPGEVRSMIRKIIKNIDVTPRRPPAQGLSIFHNNIAFILDWVLRKTLPLEQKKKLPSVLHIHKAQFLQQIEQSIGHRPRALYCHFDTLADTIRDMLEETNALYIKKDRSSGGRSIMRIAKRENKLFVEKDFAVYPLETIDTIENFIDTPDGDFIVEQEIEIPLLNNSTWEIRFVPPFDQCTYMRISAPHTTINNLTRGGHIADIHSSLIAIFRTYFSELSMEEIQRRSKDFFDKAKGIAHRCRSLLDQQCMSYVRTLFTEKDFDPAQFESIVHDTFASQFCCVDITGTFKSPGVLEPMIIEAQPDLGLLDEHHFLLDTCNQEVLQKLHRLQAAMV